MGRKFPDQKQRDQEAGQGEKGRHAKETTLGPAEAAVEEQHRHQGDPPEPLEAGHERDCPLAGRARVAPDEGQRFLGALDRRGSHGHAERLAGAP